jgi:predicted DNA-binding antitoxin AbrB/MazE fold protein
MSQVIQAIYANGVFRPLEALNLPENQQFRITVETPEDSSKGVKEDDEVINPLAGLETSTGIRDLAEHFDDYRFGIRKP